MPIFLKPKKIHTSKLIKSGIKTFILVFIDCRKAKRSASTPYLFSSSWHGNALMTDEEDLRPLSGPPFWLALLPDSKCLVAKAHLHRST